MKPYYERDGIVIYHGDCREVLPTLDRTIELLLTDPPYGHGKRWSGGTWAKNPIYELAFKWDAEPIDHATMMTAVGIARTAIVWGGNYYALPPSRCWLAWDKPKIPTMADCEFAWTNMNRPAKTFRERRNPDGKRQHPTQKPLSVMRWCLSFAPTGLVIDPFMGSGTTLVVAQEAGRRAIGIEIEEAYCEIAAKRLEQAVLPLAV